MTTWSLTILKVKFVVFVKVKLQSFVDVASIMSSYLKQFQTDNPIMPFASEILENLICWLMKSFIREAIIDEADSAYFLIKIDLQKREIHLPPESVKLPSATKTLLSSV